MLCPSSPCGHTIVLTLWAVAAAPAFLHSPSHHQWLNMLLSHPNSAAFSQAEESSSYKNYVIPLRMQTAGDSSPFSNGVSPLLRQEARCCLWTPACQWPRDVAAMYHSMLPMLAFCFFSLPSPTAQNTFLPSLGIELTISDNYPQQFPDHSSWKQLRWILLLCMHSTYTVLHCFYWHKNVTGCCIALAFSTVRLLLHFNSQHQFWYKIFEVVISKLCQLAILTIPCLCS